MFSIIWYLYFLFSLHNRSFGKRWACLLVYVIFDDRILYPDTQICISNVIASSDTEICIWNCQIQKSVSQTLGYRYVYPRNFFLGYRYLYPGLHTCIQDYRCVSEDLSFFSITDICIWNARLQICVSQKTYALSSQLQRCWFRVRK